MHRKRRIEKTMSLHLMLMPALCILLVYSYGPMLGLVMAFQKFSPALGWLHSPWVGLDNFAYVFRMSGFWSAMRNTLIIATSEIILGQVLAILLALLLNEARNRRFVKGVQTIIYLPHFLSWIILGGIFLRVLSLDGLVNNLLGALNIQPVYFLGDKTIFPLVLIFTHTWKEVGFATIVYLAAVTGIDPALYEAAQMDGAGRIKKMWHVTLPGIMPVIVLVAVLNIGSILNAGFEQVLVMYNVLVMSTGDIIDTFVYRIGITQRQYSVATAVGIFKSIIAVTLVGSSYYLAYKHADYRIF